MEKEKYEENVENEFDLGGIRQGTIRCNAYRDCRR